MCGIAGIVGDQEGDLSVPIRAMTDCMPYRGPDAEGIKIFESQGVALGHRRLSIIDLSDLGAQPMVSHDGRYWIVFNGEIYNYLEIRNELCDLGIEFRSHSDTEVLVNAYAYWGTNCLDRFNGMFAFAIWDRQERELFAARDRLGKKPFYYRHNGGGLIFASEIKSILAIDSSPREVDATLIDPFMTFGYVPGEETLFKGIMRLLPGHYLLLRNGRLAIRKYWELDFSGQRDRGLAQHMKDLDALLASSVDLRLRSDVPLGVFLSGGLDSSSIVALLAPGASSGIKTFSVAYDFGSQYNETPYARQVAAMYQTDHHEISVTPKQFMDFIPSYVRHMDEPVTEAAAISLYYVSKLAREHIVVCLSGEGADELFAGYDFYRYNLILEKVRAVFDRSLTGGIASLLKRIFRHRKFIKYLTMASLSLEDRYRGISSYEPDIKHELYSEDFKEYATTGNSQVNAFIEALFSKSRFWDPLSRMLYFDTKTWLVDDLLIKADRMSMAASIELRVPFLDHRVVAYAASMPAKYKITLNNKKVALKKLMQGYLPSSILKRKKLGFPAPLAIMLRGEMYNYASDCLLRSNSMLSQYFSIRRVARMMEDHRKCRADNHKILWQLIVLDEWMSQTSQQLDRDLF